MLVEWAHERVDGDVHVLLNVIDTGMGIAAGDMTKLFKTFSQVDSSIRRSYGGSGEFIYWYR